MTPVERYNSARDREQHAFDRSPVGEMARRLLNNPVARAHPERIGPDAALCLAAEYAFGARYPAFYAGRSLLIW